MKANVLITGTSSGFGKLTALALARKGYKVWATMRNPEGKNFEKKEALLKNAKSENLSIIVIEMDVTSDESVNNAVNIIIKEDGKIDNLINNAGIMYVGITEAYSLKQAKTQFDTNFFGILRTIKAVAPYMRKAKKGFIVNVTSLAGRLNFPYFGIYCASKSAVESYSESLGYELSPFGVEVSIVEPGPFNTGLLYSGPKEADSDVLSAYGDHKDVPAMMLKNFENFYNDDNFNYTNPQIVADDIVNLVETKRGKRPKRVVSGIDYNTKEFNEKVAPIQESLIKDSLQMQHLLELNTK